MKIHTALKVKNRQTGEVARLQEIFCRENSRRSDSTSNVDRAAIFEEFNTKASALAALKGKISLATAPISHRLALLAEFKNQISFLSRVPTRSGLEKVAYGKEVFDYTWDVYLSREDIDAKIKNIQETINGLQDEIDVFNANTDI